MRSNTPCNHAVVPADCIPPLQLQQHSLRLLATCQIRTTEQPNRFRSAKSSTIVYADAMWLPSKDQHCCGTGVQQQQLSLPHCRLIGVSLNCNCCHISKPPLMCSMSKPSGSAAPHIQGSSPCSTPLTSNPGPVLHTGTCHHLTAAQQQKHTGMHTQMP